MFLAREAHSSLEEEAYLLGRIGDGKDFISLPFYLIISKGKGLERGIVC